MTHTKFIAYYRVSTQRQGRSGLGLEAQRDAVAGFIGDGDLVDEFTDIESGKTSDRPELLKALQVAKREAATLVIAKLDRLARNVHFISGLMESGVRFVACDLAHANELTIHIIAAVAEAERKMISERTREALARAKARGVQLGNPLGNPNLHLHRDKAMNSIKTNARKFAESILPIIREVQDAGISSLNGIARALNARGVQTARGGKWSPTTVKRVLAHQSM